MPRAHTRIVATAFRTRPGVRDALRIAAGPETRRLSNPIEQLAIAHCRRHGIPLAGLDAPKAGTRPTSSTGEST